MIKLQHIFKWYNQGGTRNFVLKDVNLNINQGEFVSIMGPSGSGKSTLLHLLGNLDFPDEGNYEFLEHDVYAMKVKKREELFNDHISFVFQSYHLIDELTVYENIETPLLYKKDINSSQRKAIVGDLLDQFRIVAKKDLFPNQLSGGQQQLVGIARALATSPKIIFADEPTGNLNSQQSTEIMELFQKLNQEEKITIIQVTHSEKNATYGHRILHMLDGKLTEQTL